MRSANNGSVLGTVTSQPFHIQFVFQPGAPVRLRRFCPFLLPMLRPVSCSREPFGENCSPTTPQQRCHHRCNPRFACPMEKSSPQKPVYTYIPAKRNAKRHRSFTGAVSTCIDFFFTKDKAAIMGNKALHCSILTPIVSRSGNLSAL